MLPSPTVINTPGSREDSKSVVFTAYLKEDYYSKEQK